MSPRRLRHHVAVLFVTAICASEALAGGTIRVVNQAQIPVASLRIGSVEKLTMKPILSGRSLDLPVAAGRIWVVVGMGFFEGGLRELVVDHALPSGGFTVVEGETVRVVVPRLRAEQILAKGIGAGDPAFPARPAWSASYRSADGRGHSVSLTFSRSGEWTMRDSGRGGVTDGRISEVNWPDQSSSFSFRLGKGLVGRLDRPYGSFYLPHAGADRPIIKYQFALNLPGPGWQ